MEKVIILEIFMTEVKAYIIVKYKQLFCKYNETIGDGSYGIVITINGKHHGEYHKGFKLTKDARLSLMAVTDILKKITYSADVIEIHLKNQYVRNAITKKWIDKWVRNGFAQDTQHKDLWGELYPELKRFKEETLVFNRTNIFTNSKEGKKALELCNIAFRLPNKTTDLNINLKDNWVCLDNYFYDKLKNKS